MGFLPKDYEQPDNKQQFFDFEDGINKFRILSERPLLGWIVFSKHRPTRKIFEEPFTREELEELRVDDDIDLVPKHFWAFLIWDFKTRSIKTLDVTQSTIQRQMKEILMDDEFSDPRKYNFVISKSIGEKGEVVYDVEIEPEKELSKKDEKSIEENIGKADLSSLMRSGYPFVLYPYSK